MSYRRAPARLHLRKNPKISVSFFVLLSQIVDFLLQYFCNQYVVLSYSRQRSTIIILLIVVVNTCCSKYPLTFFKFANETLIATLPSTLTCVFALP